MATLANKLEPVTNDQWQQVNKFNREITEEFLRESPHLSKYTLIQYTSALKMFFWWVHEYAGDKSILEIKSRDFARYQNFSINRELSSNAIKMKRAAVSSLCNYIETFYEDEYENFRNFTSKVKPPPPALIHEKKPMNKDEWNKLLDELKRRGEWQKIAYLEFSYASACRRNEAVQLLKEVAEYPLSEKPFKRKNKDGTDEEFVAKFYTTHDIRCKGQGKAGKIRRLQFDRTAMAAIWEWLSNRGEDDCPYVFVHKTKRGDVKQLSVSTFNSWCSGLFTEIVGRRIHPHQLREKKATDLCVDQNKDIRVAQRVLGHNSPTTTELYVIRDVDEDALEAFV